MSNEEHLRTNKVCACGVTLTADHRRLVRELDVLLNGENAAKQASLCDIVGQLRAERIHCETANRQPDGYAYKYPDYPGPVIRFSHGEEINGSKPIEAIPYFFGTPPTAPQAEQASQPPNDAHPEHYCERCKRPNAISWFTPSDLWNKAQAEWDILCPVCFVELAESAGIRPTAWVLVPELHNTEVAELIERLENSHNESDHKYAANALRVLSALRAQPAATPTCEHEWSAAKHLHECLKDCGATMDARYGVVRSRASESSVTPATRIEIHPSEWLQLADALAATRVATPVAPIVRLTVKDDSISNVTMYAPGLPDGEHDLFCVPVGPGQWVPSMFAEPAAAEAKPVQTACDDCKADRDRLRRALEHLSLYVAANGDDWVQKTAREYLSGTEPPTRSSMLGSPATKVTAPCAQPAATAGERWRDIKSDPPPSPYEGEQS